MADKDDELLAPEEEPAGGGEEAGFEGETFEEPAAEIPAEAGGEETAEAPIEEEAPPPMEVELAPPPGKPRSDAFTAMLILSFVFFTVATVLAYLEIDEFYGGFVFF